MSQQKVIDSQSFARNVETLEGRLQLADLTRLHDLLAEKSGSIQYSLQGEVGKRGELRLRLRVAGVLSLVCQRCLEPVDFPLNVDSLLELVPEGREISQDDLEDDSRDFVPSSREMNVAALVEDEVILSLPVVPRHERCVSLPKADDQKEASPFGVLANLKTRPQ